MALPTADLISTLVTLGPPALLVFALVVVLWAGANGKIQTKQTLVLSGIAAVFFGLWLYAMPMLSKRRVYIYTTVSPQDFSTLALNPVQYRMGKLALSDLANSDFDLPDGRDPLMMTFDLKGLINSYDQNLRAVIDVARRDPQCFEDASKGVAYSQVVARLSEICPAALIGRAARYG